MGTNSIRDTARMDTLFDIAMYGDRGNPAKMRQDILRLLSLYAAPKVRLSPESSSAAFEAWGRNQFHLDSLAAAFAWEGWQAALAYQAKDTP